jgi:hypothetical protein
MTSLQIALIAGGGALALIAVAVTVFAWRGETSLIAMAETETLSTTEVLERYLRARGGGQTFGEAVEVVGTVECDAPLQAPYSDKLCVAYDYVVNEESEQQIRGLGGRKGREVEFTSVNLDDRRVPRFYVRDGSGRVAVAPAGAQLDLKETVARYEEYSNLRGNEREIWREERALLLGEQVYVLGYLLDDGGQPVIGRHPLHPERRFLVSYRDERAFAGAMRRRAYGLYLAGGLSLGGAMALVAAAFLI